MWGVECDIHTLKDGNIIVFHDDDVERMTNGSGKISNMNLLEINGNNIFTIIIVTFITSAILVPIMKTVAVHVNAMDYPNERKVHKKPMPRLGGVAIFLSFLVGYMLFANGSVRMLSILIGSFVIVLMGIFDDINPIKARYKFIIQIIAACITTFYGNIVLNDISLFGLNLSFPEPLNYIVTVFIVISITNAMNLIDGLDGLASGISCIYFGTIAIIAGILNNTGGLDVILALIMLGATLGFLVYNFPPATIFMGDSGSQFLGFIIAIISLLGFKGTTITSLIVPLLILAIPIFDVVLAIFRRLIRGNGIMKADKEHFHHQLLKMKFSQRKTILIIYFINFIFAAVSIFYVLGDNQIAIVIYIILMIALLFFVLKTDILFDHHKNDNTKNK